MTDPALFAALDVLIPPDPEPYDRTREISVADFARARKWPIARAQRELRRSGLPSREAVLDERGHRGEVFLVVQPARVSASAGPDRQPGSAG